MKKSSSDDYLIQPAQNKDYREKLSTRDPRRNLPVRRLKPARRAPPAAILFDMDGLLLDTERIARESSRITAQALGFTFTYALAHAMIGLGSDALGRLFVAELGDQFPFVDYQLMWNAKYREMLAAGIPVRPGVREVLSVMRELGLPCAVATSTHTPHAKQKLEQAGILTHFDVVVGRDAVTHGKPAPDVYLLAANRLGVDAKFCWAFEDSLPGLTAAVASGARTHWVPDLAPIHADQLPPGVETIESLHIVCEWLHANGDDRGEQGA